MRCPEDTGIHCKLKQTIVWAADLSEARPTIPWGRIYKPSFSSGYKTMEGSIKSMTRH